MNAVQQIKARLDYDTILRVVAGKLEDNAKARQKRESVKERTNSYMKKRGFPLRVL